MPRPQIRMIPPARACVYFSIFFIGISSSPQNGSMTIASIVDMVVAPKTRATRITPVMLALAAGYISIGINGSQGPMMNMVKRTQGVIRADLSLL